MKRRKPLSPSDFIKYVAKPIDSKEMDLWVKANNISIEKTQLFFDFIRSLSTIMEDTYLGNDSISTKEDVLGHFNWCWNKNIENFSKENSNIKKVDFYLNKLFKLYLEKTKSELDMLKDIYVVLDKSLIIDNK